MNPKNPQVEGPKLPSADLINFRFDQIDGSFAEIKQTLKEMTDSSIPRAELMLMKKERDEKLADLQNQINSLRTNSLWWFRAIISALLLAGATIALTFFLKP